MNSKSFHGMEVEWSLSRKPVSYKYAIDFMEKRVEKIKRGQKNELIWILEHPSIYTVGSSGKEEDIINSNNIIYCHKCKDIMPYLIWCVLCIVIVIMVVDLLFLLYIFFFFLLFHLLLLLFFLFLHWLSLLHSNCSFLLSTEVIHSKERWSLK